MSKRWAAWLLVGIAAVVLVLAFLWALFVPVADWLARQDVGPVKGPLHETALDNARGRLLTLGAGVVAAVALVFTALNFNLLRRTSERSDEWQRRTHELTEQGQVTERYTKAITQLGDDKVDVRIGGIYALERIARDSARDHPTVMEVLAAFIREHSHDELPPSGTRNQKREPSIRPDVQAAVTVIVRRDTDSDIQPINLIGADLSGAILTRANLAHANLLRADFTGANLVGASLGYAYLMSANLTGAGLMEAWLVGADLASANLTNAIFLSADLAGANLLRADLKGANFSGANLTGVMWPKGAPVPEGWKLDSAFGYLTKASTDAESAEGT